MTTKVFPTKNDVNGGIVGDGRKITEYNSVTHHNLPYAGANYIASGAGSSVGSGLSPAIFTGAYMIGGYYILKSTTESITGIVPSTTNYIWLQLTKSGGYVTGTQWVVRQTTGAPSGEASVLVATAVAGASTITSITTAHVGMILPGKLVTAGSIYAASASFTVSSSSYTNVTGMTMTVDGDGLHYMELVFTAGDIALNSGGAIGQLQLYDSTAPVSINVGEMNTSAGVNGLNVGAYLRGLVAPFNGRKTFVVRANASVGNLTLNQLASSSMYFSAKWLI